jgi:hypothetical protein
MGQAAEREVKPLRGRIDVVELQSRLTPVVAAQLATATCLFHQDRLDLSPPRRDLLSSALRAAEMPVPSLRDKLDDAMPPARARRRLPASS